MRKHLMAGFSVCSVVVMWLGCAAPGQRDTAAGPSPRPAPPTAVAEPESFPFGEVPPPSALPPPAKKNGGSGPSHARTEVILAPNNEFSIASGRPLYRVWYGTNRKPVDPSAPGKGFSDERDTSLHYGRCIVYVPKSHQKGSVGSSWITRLVTLTDDRLKLEDVALLPEADFFSRLQQIFSQKPSGKRAALVYIHGYRTDFEDAAIRAAQIGYDLKVEGITAFFSWPSKGTLFSYTADEATVEASEGMLEAFLKKIALESGAEEIHVIAHSMGNRGLLRAIQKVATDFKPMGKRFGQIFLAAPDVDIDTFKGLATVYPTISKRTTLYVSKKDIALKGSELLHEYPRAGFFPPVTVLSGIDTIQVSNVDLTLLGHGYFADAAAVIDDIRMLLESDQAPVQRSNLSRRLTDDLKEYWEIGR